MTRALMLLAIAAFIIGMLTAIWLYDWRWAVTGCVLFLGLGLASGAMANRGSR